MHMRMVGDWIGTAAIMIGSAATIIAIDDAGRGEETVAARAGREKQERGARLRVDH